MFLDFIFFLRNNFKLLIVILFDNNLMRGIFMFVIENIELMILIVFWELILNCINELVLFSFEIFISKICVDICFMRFIIFWVVFVLLFNVCLFFFIFFFLGIIFVYFEFFYLRLLKVNNFLILILVKSFWVLFEISIWVR